MPRSLGHRSQMTVHQAEEAFKRHFEGRFSVYSSNEFARSKYLVIQKSSWAALEVTMRPEEDGSVIEFSGLYPILEQRAWVAAIPIVNWVFVVRFIRGFFAQKKLMKEAELLSQIH